MNTETLDIKSIMLRLLRNGSASLELPFYLITASISAASCVSEPVDWSRSAIPTILITTALGLVLTKFLPQFVVMIVAVLRLPKL